MLLVLLMFIAVFAIVVVPYWAFVIRPEGTAQATLLQRLRAGGGPRLRRLAVLKDQGAISTLAGLDAALAKASRPGRRLTELVEQSGLKIGPTQLILLCLGVGALAGVVTVFFSNELWLGGVIGGIATTAPYVYVRRVATIRMRKFEEHFPEAVDLIARALRAGHAFTTGLSMVPDEIPDPVGAEFKLLYDQQNYGMALPDAMKAFGARIPVLEARFFVTAVLTQREVGGNLSEVLDNLSAVMRERFKVKRQVRVISAHGRITGWILSGLPPTLALALFAISPQHMGILIKDPLGIQMIIAAVVLQVIGTLIIRKIVNVEY